MDNLVLEDHTKLLEHDNEIKKIKDTLNEFKLDACGIGNHEFDWDLPEILKFFDIKYCLSFFARRCKIYSC